jgi:N-acetylneuraminate synthase/N,N'-diacetyllegionaminate synthase
MEIKIGDRLVGPGHPAFVIAEAGINHNGDPDTAVRLVHAAKEAGADAVKFQTFTAESLMVRSAGGAKHLEAAAEDEVFSFVEQVALSEQLHQLLFETCKQAGIPFLSTAGNPDGVDLLERLGVSAYKIASMDLDNLPLLSYAASTGKPMILSTGMGTLSEVERAIETVYAAGNQQIVVLHCVALYPAPVEDVNLLAMATIRDAFDVAVGYSDHTLGNAVATGAVALGATVIEKHFTLDKSMPGPDQAISGDPKDFLELIQGIRLVETALGTRAKRPAPQELEMRRAFRRSIVAAVDIEEGTALTTEMLVFKRPGAGISPANLSWVVGRTASRAIAADAALSEGDLI